MRAHDDAVFLCVFFILFFFLPLFPFLFFGISGTRREGGRLEKLVIPTNSFPSNETEDE